MPDKNAPLTSEEITEAANIFFPLFNIVNEQLILHLFVQIFERWSYDPETQLVT